MKFNVYNRELKWVGRIESFISAYYSGVYDEMGTLTVELLPSHFSLLGIDENYFIRRTDRKEVFVVKSIEGDEESVTLGCKGASRLYDDRAFTGTINDGVKARTALQAVVDNVESFSMFKTECLFLNISDDLKTIHQISNDSAYNIIETICKDLDIGFRVELNDETLQFVFYRPKNNPMARFSDRFGTAGNLSYKFSNDKHKNVAVVLGQGRGEERVEIVIGETDSVDYERRELVVDARHVQQEEEETDEAYYERLAIEGYKHLVDCNYIQSVTFDVLSTGFPTQYDLGDGAIADFFEFGVKISDARIYEFTQKEQANSISLKIEVSQKGTRCS